VDEDHPTVQELVRAGYNVEQSTEAVEHSEELKEAMDYLLSLEGKKGIVQSSISMLTKEEHQYWEERKIEFVEESQQERPLYVFHLYSYLTRTGISIWTRLIFTCSIVCMVVI